MFGVTKNAPNQTDIQKLQHDVIEEEDPERLGGTERKINENALT